ncbi:MAG: hypothetical protein OXR68_03620 [Alphaproteobacteria bacterium]|nr:hypothetical protein [Alphaproteobacteria bacterium]MDD9919695.1 hypothetical protein [Alphaproteobacteria bacterium]
MIKLFGFICLGIVALYGLEFAGIVPQGKYLPFVPRWEQPASLPTSEDLKWQTSDNISETRAHTETDADKFTDRVSNRL